MHGFCRSRRGGQRVPGRALGVFDDPFLPLHRLGAASLQAFEDIPTPARVTISAEDWEREWLTWPEGSLVALAEGEIVGCAGLLRDPDRPDRAENSLTAVRRDWRGRGLATALKQAVIAWAAANGLLEIYTWTQTGNEAMQRLNEKLGYRSRMISITVRGPIPARR